MSPNSLVRSASSFADRTIPPPQGVTVLIYHRVGGGSDSAVDLPPSQFKRQLEHLVEHHRVIDLASALLELEQGPPVGDPRRPVVVTFDDGTADFAEHALPALVDHSVPATLYVATEFIDEGRPFPWGAPPVSWGALRDAVGTGLMTLGSHTHSHWLMDRLEPAAIGEDLDLSIGLLSEQTGCSPVDFAYPKAVPGSPSAEVEIRRRFRSAALARNRVNRFGRSDPHRLWRTPVKRTDDDAQFAAKADGGHRLEGELRAVMARLTYRGLAR